MANMYFHLQKKLQLSSLTMGKLLNIPHAPAVNQQWGASSPKDSTSPSTDYLTELNTYTRRSRLTDYEVLECARPVSPETMLQELSFVSLFPRSTLDFNNPTSALADLAIRSADLLANKFIASIVGRPRHHG